ncbi:MAG: RNase adapter RapZ [Acidobacteria bacterium]|nr:RNase adapter RapZ [Acidobacteriota bacterium]MCI0720243.1 RNase adapter RapZ [Acidobacteriota bacterium]
MKSHSQSDKTPFVIITGLSGSGKGTVLKAFEDMGYFCVDNLPVELVVKFAELSSGAGSQPKKAAIVIDVREGAELSKFPAVYRKLKKSGLAVTLIYLEASEDSLIRRYSETRRPHPLTQDRPIAVALDEERRRLEPIQRLADTHIDTTQFNVHELRRYIADKFHEQKSSVPLLISLISFGFKNGVPLESDLVFDVRFLPNPNFVKSLKDKSGLDSEVVEYVKSFSQTSELLKRLSDLLLFLVPNYVIEGKSYLTISVGCTGGQHRSVMITQELNTLLSSRGYKTKVNHRDMMR